MPKVKHSGGSKLINDFVDRLIVGSKRTLKRTDNPYQPLSRRQQLKPDSVYVSGKRNSPIRYAYRTDSMGRIRSAHARPLQLPPNNKRGWHNPRTPGKRRGDHAGHLFADMFGGSGGRDNLVSMSRDANLREMGRLEDRWKKMLTSTPPVEPHVDIKVNYSGDDLRPTSFVVYEIVDGVKKEVGRFSN